MKVHVLTAVSRPENLGKVAESLARAAESAPAASITWHWCMDIGRTQVGGQAPKNRMLDEISDGWVYVLDDDTLMHPDLLGQFAVALERWPALEAMIVAQRRFDGRVLPALERYMVPGGVDMGQALLHRDLIGDSRIPESYEGDGHFIMELVRRSERVLYVDEVLSFHNALSGVEVSV